MLFWPDNHLNSSCMCCHEGRAVQLAFESHAGSDSQNMHILHLGTVSEESCLVHAYGSVAEKNVLIALITWIIKVHL